VVVAVCNSVLPEDIVGLRVLENVDKAPAYSIAQQAY